MDIWTIVILGGIAFLLLSFLAPRIPNFNMPDIPFINPGNETNQTSNLPEPIEKGKQYLEDDYTLPGWLILALIIFVWWVKGRK